MSNFRKIDAHLHLNAANAQPILDTAKACGFESVVTINTDVTLDNWPGHAEQFRFVTEWLARGPSTIPLHFLGTFDTANVTKPNWKDETLEGLRRTIRAGAKGIKVWKNVGMELKDESDKFVMVDDPRLQPVFEFLAKEQVPLIGHCGEPRNCWLPLEEMTTLNDAGYFRENPKFHMALHPEFPCYESQIAARNGMLSQHPDLWFIGAHLGSEEYSIERLAATLDRFPRMAADTAHRVGHLMAQHRGDPAERDRVRDFLTKYAGRIIYGTDLQLYDGDDAERWSAGAACAYAEHWRYFSTAEPMESEDVEGEVLGLGLDKASLAALYSETAARWYKL